MPYGIRPWTTKPMFKVSRWLFWTFINDMPWCNINHGVNTAYIHNYTANYYAVIKDCNWDPSWHIQQWIHPSSSFVNLGCPTEHEIEGLDENERRILEKRTLRLIQWTNEAQINLYYGPLVLNVRHYVRFLVHLLSIWSFFGITYGIISDLRFWSLESDPWRTYTGTISGTLILCPL